MHFDILLWFAVSVETFLCRFLLGLHVAITIFRPTSYTIVNVTEKKKKKDLPYSCQYMFHIYNRYSQAHYIIYTIHFLYHKLRMYRWSEIYFFNVILFKFT